MLDPSEHEAAAAGLMLINELARGHAEVWGELLAAGIGLQDNLDELAALLGRFLRCQDARVEALADEEIGALVSRWHPAFDAAPEKIDTAQATLDALTQHLMPPLLEVLAQADFSDLCPPSIALVESPALHQECRQQLTRLDALFGQARELADARDQVAADSRGRSSPHAAIRLRRLRLRDQSQLPLAVRGVSRAPRSPTGLAPIAAREAGPKAPQRDLGTLPCTAARTTARQLAPLDSLGQRRHGRPVSDRLLQMRATRRGGAQVLADHHRDPANTSPGKNGSRSSPPSRPNLSSALRTLPRETTNSRASSTTGGAKHATPEDGRHPGCYHTLRHVPTVPPRPGKRQGEPTAPPPAAAYLAVYAYSGAYANPGSRSVRFARFLPRFPPQKGQREGSAEAPPKKPRLVSHPPCGLSLAAVQPSVAGRQAATNQAGSTGPPT